MNREVALVTGGAVRLGRAIVTELVRSGWRVAFTYRTSKAAAIDFANTLGDQGVAIHADIDSQRTRAAVVKAVRDRYGRLDALVNNAAVFPHTPLARLAPSRLREVMRTNLEAPVFLALSALPLLRERRGCVVNMSDIHAHYPLRGHFAYTVSKAALVAATRALAVELAPRVRVNGLALGAALFSEEEGTAARARRLSRVPMGREIGPLDVARAVRFLIEGTETLTGHVLVLDGGRTLVL